MLVTAYAVLTHSKYDDEFLGVVDSWKEVQAFSEQRRSPSAIYLSKRDAIEKTANYIGHFLPDDTGLALGTRQAMIEALTGN